MKEITKAFNLIIDYIIKKERSNPDDKYTFKDKNTDQVIGVSKIEYY
jgi:hypothetical protein